MYVHTQTENEHIIHIYLEKKGSTTHPNYKSTETKCNLGKSASQLKILRICQLLKLVAKVFKFLPWLWGNHFCLALQLHFLPFSMHVHEYECIHTHVCARVCKQACVCMHEHSVRVCWEVRHMGTCLQRKTKVPGTLLYRRSPYLLTQGLIMNLMLNVSVNQLQGGILLSPH